MLLPPLQNIEEKKQHFMPSISKKPILIDKTKNLFSNKETVSSDSEQHYD